MPLDGRKISELSFIVDLQDADILPIVDLSVSEELNRKVSVGQLLTDASTSTRGRIRLNGDLAGTADYPTVPALNSKAPLNSPNLAGTPTVPTPSSGNSSIQIANTQFVSRALSNLISSDIIQNLASKSYVDSSVNAAIDAIPDVSDASPTSKGVLQLTGDLAGTAASPTVPALVFKAPLSSPNFTGSPTAPTPVSASNDASVATTAFVKTSITNSTVAATPASKGIVQLAGDLAGTAEAPIVPALANKAEVFALNSHVNNSNNPHSVTAAQVGNTSPIWNANKLFSRDIANTTPSDKQALVWNAANNVWEPGNVIFDQTTVALTGRNTGNAGVGVFIQKNGQYLEFKNIYSGSNKVSVSDNVSNGRIDIDIVSSQIDKNSLGGGNLNISQGGTGLSTTPNIGQLLIGTGSGYALSTLTAGSGITITNLAGSITIAANVNAIVGDASTSNKGIIKLSGDLYGTADLPYVVSATTTNRGIVRLQGDLGGNADSPTVITNTTSKWNASKLRDIDIDSTSPLQGQVLVYNSNSNKWVPGSAVGSDSFVDLVTSQTVGGIKTFSASPIVQTTTHSGLSVDTSSSSYDNFIGFNQGGIAKADIVYYGIGNYFIINRQTTNTSINPNGGNVGIGLGVPLSTLHVKGGLLVSSTTSGSNPGAGNLSVSGSITSASLSTGNVSFTGTITGNLGKDTAQWNSDRLQSRTVASTAPSNGQALVWNSTNSVWEPGAPQVGAGQYVDLTTDQSVSGIKTFSNSVVLSSGGSTTTEATTDSSIKIASTAFVKNVLANYIFNGGTYYG